MHARTIVALIAFLCFCGCYEDKTILELDDIQDFQAIEKREASQLQISGIAFHSALGVRKMTTQKQGQDLIIKLHLALAGEKYSPHFNFTITIPAGVTTVRFGKDRKEIWKQTL